jgi:hypothetical protein
LGVPLALLIQNVRQRRQSFSLPFGEAFQVGESQTLKQLLIRFNFAAESMRPSRIRAFLQRDR